MASVVRDRIEGLPTTRTSSLPRSQKRTARGRSAVGGTTVDAFGDAGQLDAAARGDRHGPAVGQWQQRRQQHVIVDEGEPLLLALRLGLDEIGRSPRQAAGGIVAQQVRRGLGHGLDGARRRPGGADEGVVERGRVARLDEAGGFDLRADLEDVLAGLEIDAEGAAIAFEEQVRGGGEGDGATGADTMRRQPPESGARAGPVRGAKVSKGSSGGVLVTTMASRFGTSRCRLRVCWSGWISRARTPVTRTCALTRAFCGSGCCQWPATVTCSGVPSQPDELGDQVAGRVGADALDDAADVETVGVIEVLERAAGDEGLRGGQAVRAELEHVLGDDQRQRIAGVGVRRRSAGGRRP